MRAEEPGAQISEARKAVRWPEMGVSRGNPLVFGGFPQRRGREMGMSGEILDQMMGIGVLFG